MSNKEQDIKNINLIHNNYLSNYSQNNNCYGRINLLNADKNVHFINNFHTPHRLTSNSSINTQDFDNIDDLENIDDLKNIFTSPAIRDSDDFNQEDIKLFNEKEEFNILSFDESQCVGCYYNELNQDSHMNCNNGCLHDINNCPYCG
jgi:hypothetical protein